MTLYRIRHSTKKAEVLDTNCWRALSGDEDEILIEELNPQALGEDDNYRYVLTDEP